MRNPIYSLIGRKREGEREDDAFADLRCSPHFHPRGACWLSRRHNVRCSVIREWDDIVFAMRMKENLA